MKLVLLLLYILVSALVLAALEIQIEGKHGWAAKLPTFKMKKKLLGVKPLTGYHVFFLLFTLLIFHFPIFFISHWCYKNELLVLGTWILVWSLEDFLWFVINPHFGLKKFNKDNKDLWWHQSWFLGLPTFYWFSFPLGIFLIALGL